MKNSQTLSRVLILFILIAASAYSQASKSQKKHRDKAVMALDFVAGKDDYSALGVDGLLMEDGPVVIIPPHTLKTFTWFLGEIKEGETIVLASAVFADGKEEGDKRSLDGMKIHRRHFQQNQRDAKTKN